MVSKNHANPDWRSLLGAGTIPHIYQMEIAFSRVTLSAPVDIPAAAHGGVILKM
jgi:hypothetical protein